MNKLKKTLPFVIAMLLAVYVVAIDWLFGLWLSLILIVLGVLALRKDDNERIRKTARGTTHLLLILGVLFAVVVIVYVLMVQGYSNHFDR